MADSSVKLEDLLEDIDKNRLVLPDFQRDYVWIKEDDKIEDFIASVLSQLPIGSIITFKDNFNSFANKEIGFNKSIEYNDNFGKVEFLLDGQQRITTLALVFSDRIFKKIKDDPTNHSNDDLVQKDKIKKRYFLKVPKTEDDFKSDDDFFGYENLHFPYEDPDKITFCSNDIRDLIHTETFTFATNDPKRNEWYYPIKSDHKDTKFTRKVKESASDMGLIPLFYLTDNSDLVKKVLNALAEKRYNYISDIYDDEHMDELKEYLKNNEKAYKIDLTQDDKEIYDEFKQVLEDNRDKWADDMFLYLTSCIKQLRINTIAVDDENTSRAINMYEALNKGGAKLTTYDLIIARAASKSQYGKKSYAQLNRDIISEYYNKPLFNLVSKGTGLSEWNSKQYLQTITKNGEIVPVVINQFLNLLCYVSFNADSDHKMPQVQVKKIPNDYCKAKKQLDMTSEMIVKNSDLCMKSIMDALMILQLKCGIFDVSQIDYNLILLPLSYMMYLYESKSIPEEKLNEVVDKFCGLYYFFIFTGEYASDQSTVVMKHLEWVNNWLLCDIVPTPFEADNQYTTIDKAVLNMPKYNDFSTLLYENDNSPKKAVRNSILHYVLSGQPSDFIKDSGYTTLNAWTKEMELEIHHMVPLASATSIKESTKEIRDLNEPINSPLNMALISKKANRTISNYQISQYENELDTTFLHGYKLPPNVKEFVYSKSDSNDNILKEIFKYRYDALKAEIISKFKTLIS